MSTEPRTAAAPAPGARPPWMVRRGDWDRIEGFVCRPRGGKSVLMMRQILPELDRCYVLAHDPNWNLPARLPDGTRVPLVRHEDPNHIRRGLETMPRAVHATAGDPSALIEQAKEIAAAGLERHSDGHEYGPPVIVILDEIVVWEEARRGGEPGPVLMDLLARRRPHHVGLWYASQYARQAHYSLYSLATTLYLGNMPDLDDVAKLRRGGVPSDVLERLPSLPRYHFLRYRR